MSDLASAVAAPPAPQPTPQQAILFENVVIGFDRTPVLNGVSFEVRHGQTKVLLGVAGSGKSTILKLALGLIKPDHGRIFVLGQEVSSMTEEQLFEVRRNIGMVFQESALFDSLSVYENVSYRLREEGNIPEPEIQQRVREALRFVELERTVNMMPGELSGGMRRRVAIARAIVARPEILLYDSPTGGLDPVTSTTIIELIVKQRDAYHSSSLLVTHRLQDAFLMATHYFDVKTNKMAPLQPDTPKDMHTSFLLLRDGKVIFDGLLPDLINNDDPYIREYIR